MRQYILLLNYFEINSFLETVNNKGFLSYYEKFAILKCYYYGCV